MNNPGDNQPVILSLSGHDPTGAAGIQADIESIHANHGRCISVITTLTVQDTAHFFKMIPQDPVEFRNQVETLIADIPVSACKVGLIGNIGLLNVISDLVDQMINIPLVVDPILHSGSGTPLSDHSIVEGYMDRIIPKATIITPNLHEAVNLSGINDPDDAAEKLLSTGCKNVLITDTRPEYDKVANTLYVPGNEPWMMEWDRLTGTYHGSGCTLSSAVAAYLAGGESVQHAVEKAQRFTWQSLQQGVQIGQGQLHPHRLL